MSHLTFEHLAFDDKEKVFSWLQEKHVQEFWDNTPAYKEDILNFMGGRLTPSTYADGDYVYWIAKMAGQPFAMLMTILETLGLDIDPIKHTHLSQAGRTYGIEYMIGSPDFVGKGYGASTLEAFMDFFRAGVDQDADTFFIDPAVDNTKARRVYGRAGFDYIGDFVMSGDVSGEGKFHHFFVKYCGEKKAYPAKEG